MTQNLAPSARALPRAALALALLVLPLSACSGASNDPGGEIQVEDAWVKAAGEGQMTAAFAVITNHTGHDATIVAASSPSSDTVQLHETVAGADGTMAMRQKEGGFAIPDGGTLTLEPGGNHIMLMNLPDAIAPGDDVTVTLSLADGTLVTFDAIAKDFAGANESYSGGGAGTTGSE